MKAAQMRLLRKACIQSTSGRVALRDGSAFHFNKVVRFGQSESIIFLLPEGQEEVILAFQIAEVWLDA